MAEFAFLALFAVALFEEYAQDCFWVDSKGHFLHLHGFEEFGRFAFRGFGGGFFSLLLRFFGFFSFLFGGFGGGGLGFQLFDLFLSRRTFFLEWAGMLVGRFEERLRRRLVFVDGEWRGRIGDALLTFFMPNVRRKRIRTSLFGLMGAKAYLVLHELRS